MTLEVTQEDRDAYLAMNMLPEFDAADVRAGRWDGVTGVQAFAAHRQAADRKVVEWLEGMAAKCDATFKSSGDHGIGCAREAYRRAISAIERGEHRK